PVTAVRMVWALAGAFSSDPDSKLAAARTEAAVKQLRDRAEKEEPREEKDYVLSAIVAMNAALRNLDIMQKGRELNFQENERLRQTCLDSVAENIAFGNKARDFLKSLPTITIGGAGSVTLAAALQRSLKLSDLQLWGIGLTAAALGYLVHLGVVRLMRRRTQMLYVVKDYERGLYYSQYVTRAAVELTSLYLDVDRIHKNVFGQSYQVETDAQAIVGEMLKGIRPTFCKYAHEHVRGR
ncbi:MAG: hypothetical protein RDU41_09340, partial [Clostridia bacterium]|nr:hypothetical protein [Clostridia bacterium]